MRDPTQAVVAIEDDITAGLSGDGRRPGAGNALVGDPDAFGGDLDTEPERVAWAGCVSVAIGDAGSCLGRRGDYSEPDVCNDLISLPAVEDGAGSRAGAPGADFAGNARG